MERAVFEERVLDSEFLRRQLGCWLSSPKWKVPRTRSRALDGLCPSPVAILLNHAPRSSEELAPIQLLDRLFEKKGSLVESLIESRDKFPYQLKYGR
jgi:hypothetical protein